MQVPTAAQMQMCPAVWTGRDVVATAPPGTGKTLGFLLPTLHRCVHHSVSGRGSLCHNATVLVLEPFRELALQVETQAKVRWRLRAVVSRQHFLTVRLARRPTRPLCAECRA